MYTTDTTLAELATQIPAAARVFHRHRLDFCCGGGVSLSEACEKRGLDAEEVLEEIDQQPPEPSSVTGLSTSQLVDHIVARYHVPLRPELARLLAMATKVEGVHQDKSTCPHGLAEHLAQIKTEVEQHLAKEEQILFPAIKRGVGAMALGPIRVMTLEHDEHAANLRMTRSLTNDLVAPPEACNTWRALYLGLEELERELMEHIHLENHVLFPAVLRS